MVKYPFDIILLIHAAYSQTIKTKSIELMIQAAFKFCMVLKTNGKLQ